MLKMKSLAVWTSKAVWSPNSPCSSSTSSDTCADSCSRVAPERKSTSENFLAGAGERGVTALIRDSISTTLLNEDRESETVVIIFNLCAQMLENHNNPTVMTKAVETAPLRDELYTHSASNNYLF